MRPAARAQAAIELLDQIARDTAPADRLVAGYFRARRYAGAKDRAAINDIVYGVLRHRGDYAWHGGGADSRGLVLAHLMRRPDADAEAIEALFDGGRFAPAPLETAEREILDRLAGPAKAPAPAWARGNYPAWLHEGLESQFGDGLATEMAALNGRAPVDLRVNTLKSEPAEAAAELAADGIATRPGRWSPACLSLAERTDISRHRLYRDGHVEVQDQGSQIAALLTGGAAGEQVVDYCAGGGGKSLALAAMMGNRGQIFAFDQDPRRLRQLH
ncbi:MAG: MFS transporter, partial [Alphaproteobacteria bacterium]|nr:MFS transporter [Alphaproteobacteria bacterium]